MTSFGRSIPSPPCTRSSRPVVAFLPSFRPPPLFPTTSPELGQKTGFYADQRENRRALGSLCQGKRVLDLFCYTGGFALAAAKNGAACVVGVDSSALAVETAAENARANGFGLDAGRVSFVKADVLDFIRGQLQQLEEHEQEEEEEGGGASSSEEGGRLRLFDVVVADPPKLAPSKKDLPRALHKYGQINRAAMSMLRPGGLLLTHTCSAALTQAGAGPDGLGLFRDVVRRAAHDVGRSVTVLRVAHAADCHVINPSYPENEYLTAVLCVVN